MRVEIALALSVAVGLTLGFAPHAQSRILGGHGTQGDCYAVFDNITSTRPSGQPRVDCEAGDPACATPNDCHNSCTFKVGVCINQTDVVGCTPPAGGLVKIKALPRKYKGLVNGLDLTQSTCTPTLTDVVVTTPRKGKTPGKQQLRLFATAPRGTRPGVDSDVVLLYCKPRPSSEPCPTTTTTTSTTTTTLP